MGTLGSIADYFENKLPGLAPVVNDVRTSYRRGRIRRMIRRFQSMEPIFSEIRTWNTWGGVDSVSGPGSDLKETLSIRPAIIDLFRDLQIKTLLDAPCGDFFWVKEFVHELCEYIGVDIVKDLIEENNRKYENDHVNFQCLDITKDPLPRVDLILCRDCLVHFSFKHIRSVLLNFKKTESRYLLTTTFPEHEGNENIITGYWRPLNLNHPPFNFPEPLQLINEGCSLENGQYSDKSLGLWKFDEIQIFF